MAEAPRLKAMSSTEILDAAFRLYRGNFGTFLGIFAIVYVPVTLIVVAVTGALLPEAQAALAGAATEEDQNAAMNHLQLVQGLVQVVQLFLYALIEMPLATGALTFAVGMRYLNEPASIGSAFGRLLPMFLKYLGTTMLSGLVIGLAFLTFMLPGLFLLLTGNVALGGLLFLLGVPFSVFFGYRFLTWFFATSSIVCLEGLGGTSAMGRSRQLVRGFGGRVFGFLFLIGLLQGVMVMPVSAGSQFLLPMLTESLTLQFTLATVGEQIVSMLVTPFFSAVVVLLYYDLRIRKEAFDLEVLAKNLGAPAPAGAAPAQP